MAVGNQFFHNGEDAIQLHYAAAGATQGSKPTVYNESGSVVYSGPVGHSKKEKGLLSGMVEE